MHLLKVFICRELWPFCLLESLCPNSKIKNERDLSSPLQKYIFHFSTHYNLSPVTQITMQQTMRTLAFACESCVFAYLGLAIFSFPHKFDAPLIIWSILFILLGRALNIFPLSYVCNRFRSHQITKKMMVIMWFSGKIRLTDSFFMIFMTILF